MPVTQKACLYRGYCGAKGALAGELLVIACAGHAYVVLSPTCRCPSFDAHNLLLSSVCISFRSVNSWRVPPDPLCDMARSSISRVYGLARGAIPPLKAVLSRPDLGGGLGLGMGGRRSGHPRSVRMTVTKLREPVPVI